METPSRWVEVREPGTGFLLFLYDPARDLVQIKRPGAQNALHVIDLTRYRAEATTTETSRGIMITVER